MYLSDQSVRNTNCPLSPLHHALHNQLHLQNISSQSEANVYGKLILQNLWRFSQDMEWCCSLQSSWISWCILLIILKEFEKENVQITGEPTREVMTSRWIMAPALVSSQPKLSPMPLIGSPVPQFLQGADIRIF